MNILFISLFMCLVLLLPLGTPATAAASGGGGWAPAHRVDTDFDRAEKAIKDKDYVSAITYLNAVVARDPQDAEAYNLLGYSERMRGNLNEAFDHYERALAINPKHRGAHEYIGETYLLAGNLSKAEEHLAILDKLCLFPCEEYRDLKAAIADYKAKQMH
jgi:tetratricopeptide (TPR) repeat protein